MEGKDDRESGDLFVAVARGRKVDRELSGLTVVEEHMPDFAPRPSSNRPSSNRSCSNWSSGHGAGMLAEADQGY